MQPLVLLSNVPTGDGATAAAAKSGAAGTTGDVPGFGALVEGMIAATPVTGPLEAPPVLDPARGDMTADDTVMAGLMQALGLAPQPVATAETEVMSTLPAADADVAASLATGAGAPWPEGLEANNGLLTGTVPGEPAAEAPTPEAAPAAPPVATGPAPAALMSLAATQAVAAGLVPANSDGAPAGPALRPALSVGRGEPRGRNEAAAATVTAAQSSMSAAEARPALAVRPEPIAPIPGDAANDGATTLAGAPVAPEGDGMAAPAIAGHTAPRDVAAPHAAGMARTASGHVVPAQQVVGRIEQAIQNGQTTLTVKLDPDHLGKVEVKLELQDGRVSAHISAERPATLDLLQRDARLIERAMEQSGMQVQPDGLHFSLSDGNAQWAESGQGRRGARLYGEQVQADPTPDPLTPVASRSESLVDIQI